MLASYPFQDSQDKRNLKRHTPFPNARSEKRKIQAQNDRVATNPIICWINHRKERKERRKLWSIRYIFSSFPEQEKSGGNFCLSF